jgi:cbb3-type cytochrome oxidase subunit 3
MFWISDSTTIEGSLFENNTVVWIVGQPSSNRSSILTFRNCYFDAFTALAQGNATVQTEGCLIGARNFPSTALQCPMGGLSAGAIAGIVVGGLALISIVIVAVVCWIKRKKRRTNAAMEARLIRPEPNRRERDYATPMAGEQMAPSLYAGGVTLIITPLRIPAVGRIGQ